MALTSEIIASTLLKYRTDRHISLRAAAHGLSNASISRFENNLTDISTLAASQLMSNIGMGALDFADAVNQPGYLFPNPMNAIVHHDLQSLQGPISDYFAFHKDILPNKMTAPLKQLLRLTRQGDAFRLPPSLEQRLADLLAYPIIWDDYELTLLALALPHASQQFQQLIWYRLCHRPFESRNACLRHLILTALWCVTTAEPNFKESIATEMEAILQNPHFESKAIVWLPELRVTRALALCQDPTPVIDATRSVGAHVLADYLTAICQHCPKTWQNPALEDHYDPRLDTNCDTDILSGPFLKQMRLQRGLKLTDVSLDWSESAQSRFEAGITEMPFTRTLRLIDLLMIPVTMTQEGTNVLGAFEQSRRRLLAMSRSNADNGGISREDLSDFLATFSLHIAHHPQGMQVMEVASFRWIIQQFAAASNAPIDSLTANLTPNEIKSATKYLAQISRPSFHDLYLMKGAINFAPTACVLPLVASIVPKIQPHSAAYDKFLANPTACIGASIYGNEHAVLDQLKPYVVCDSALDYDWRVAEATNYFDLIYAAWYADTPELREQATRHQKAVRVLNPHKSSVWSAEHWLEYAFTKDKNVFQ